MDLGGLGVFDRVADPGDLEVVMGIEGLTNDRLREEIGDLALVPKGDRVSGPCTTPIMAAFTHPPVDGRGGRFNRDFGIYYCAADEAVAIAEAYLEEVLLRPFDDPDGVDGELGRIAPGMRADLIVLDRNIFTLDPMDIPCAQVDLTLFDGRIVYRR